VLVLACGVLPAATVLAESVAFSAQTSLVPAIEHLAGPICHHDPERTPAIEGRLLPVCARCVGLYVGAAAGGLVGLLVPPHPSQVRRALLVAITATTTGLLFALLEAMGLLSTPNSLRLGLGTGLGLGVPLLGAMGGSLLLRIR
jgi:uncharacterized membrane protein